MRSEVQMAQVRNLNKRIEQYEKDIEKLKLSSNKALFDE
jgi:cell division protein FtsB